MAGNCSAGLFDMAILAVPAGAAQQVADTLVSAGIGSILNFAPTRVVVPGGVAVRQVDLSTELQILSYYG
jgi:redox-sensing transcriptional repressor